MLQILGKHIADCYARAEWCKRRAEQTAAADVQAEFLDLERSWLQLAKSYEFVETLERFLLSARNHPIGTPQNDPADHD